MIIILEEGQYVSSHLHFDVEYVFEADEDDNIRIKEDENSDIKWVDIDKVNDYSTEEIMKPIYTVLNEKLEKLSVK